MLHNYRVTNVSDSPRTYKKQNNRAIKLFGKKQIVKIIFEHIFSIIRTRYRHVSITRPVNITS